MIDALYNGGLNLVAQDWWTGGAWPVIWNFLKILAVLLPLLGAVAYLTLWAVSYTHLTLPTKRIV